MNQPNQANQVPDLGKRFEESRAHLRAVAYRVLGSQSEADDAVQEAWLRLSRSETGGVANLGGWLTTVVARVCLDMLRSRTARREEPLTALPEPVSTGAGNPENEALLADSVGAALLVVLDTLSPAERLAFVLHDLFGVPFDEIAPIVDRSPSAARQLASRARRRVQGRTEAPPASAASSTRQKEIVDAFLTAARAGNFDALVAVLDPNVALRADRTAVRLGSQEVVRGVDAVAKTFSGRARDAQRALINGAAGLVWAPGGQLRVVLFFTTAGEKITKIDLVADPERIRTLDLIITDDAPKEA